MRPALSRSVHNLKEVRDGVLKSPYDDITLATNVNLAHHVMKDFEKYHNKTAIVRIFNNNMGLVAKPDLS